MAHCINCYISGYDMLFFFFYNIAVNLIWGGLKHLPHDCDWLSGRQSEIKFLTGLVCRILFIMNLEALSTVHFTVMFLVIIVVRKS